MVLSVCKLPAVDVVSDLGQIQKDQHHAGAQSEQTHLNSCSFVFFSCTVLWCTHSNFIYITDLFFLYRMPSRLFVVAFVAHCVLFCLVRAVSLPDLSSEYAANLDLYTSVDSTNQFYFPPNDDVKGVRYRGAVGCGLRVEYPSYRNTKFIGSFWNAGGGWPTLSFMSGPSFVFRLPVITRTTSFVTFEMSTPGQGWGSRYSLAYDKNNDLVIDVGSEAGPGWWGQWSQYTKIISSDGSLSTQYNLVMENGNWYRLRFCVDLVNGVSSMYVKQVSGSGSSWTLIEALSEIPANIDWVADSARNPLKWNAFVMQADCNSITMEGLSTAAFNPGTYINESFIPDICPAGFYCPSMKSKIACPTGTSPAGSYNSDACVSSLSCIDREVCNVPACHVGISWDKYKCSDGECRYVADMNGNDAVCVCLAPTGSHCPTGSLIPTACPANSYCTGRTAIPAACPNGLISPANSPSLAYCMSPCSAGFTRMTAYNGPDLVNPGDVDAYSTITGNVGAFKVLTHNAWWAGGSHYVYFFPQGSSSNPSTSVTLTVDIQWIQLDAYSCSSASPDACSYLTDWLISGGESWSVTFGSGFGYLKIKPSTNLLQTVSISFTSMLVFPTCTACDQGSYCPAGASAQTQCPESFYCQTTTSKLPCPSGRLCPAGTVTPIQCPAGSFCVAGVETACSSSGSYCAAGSTAEGACPASSYCPNTASVLPCLSGSLCPARTVTPIQCPAGMFCGSGVSVGTACSSAGAYCAAGSTAQGTCPVYSYCPNAASMLPCPSGSMCPEGTVTPIQCPAGLYCAASVSAGTACALGSYCLAGSSAEAACPMFFYCQTTASKLPCPSGSMCPAGTVAPIQCPAGSFCVASVSAGVQCPAGMYCGSGVSVGTACSLGFACPAGSVSPTSCVKPANSYYTGHGTGAATSCPWTCNAGYYLDGNLCSQCAANSWCIAGAQNTCPSNTLSPALSSSQNQCLCAPGYFGNGSRAGTSPCPICTSGSYCPGGNADLIHACPGNYLSPTGSAAASDCNCKPGYKLAADSSRCIECVSGELCLDGVATSCPPNTLSPPGSFSSADCVCAPGFVGVGSECTQCPENYVCPGGNVQLPCAANAVSPVQSTNSSACYCDRGYEGIENSTCVPCPPNAWCWTGVINQCPPNTSSPAMSNYIRNCTCSPGFTGPNGTSCSPCAAGTYNSLGGNANCSVCPLGNFCVLGAPVPSQCPVDSYCGSGVHQPTACPQFSNSEAGSDSMRNCNCLAGYSMVKGVCIKCAHSTYSSAGTTDVCDLCPMNSNTSSPGAVSMSQCLCSPGFVGDSMADVYPVTSSWSLLRVCGVTGNQPCSTTARDIYSNQNLWIPSNGVDGVTTTGYHSNDNTLPDGEYKWWRIDLASRYWISDGIITAMWSDRLTGFQIWIGDDETFPGTNKLKHRSSTLNPDSEAFRVGGIGRYLYVANNRSDNFLMFAEIDVFGGKGPCAVCPGGLLCPGGAVNYSTVCPANHYCPIGSSVPVLCPALSTSVPNSASFSSCLCSNGYFMKNNLTCELCGHGTYAIKGSVNACTQCPPGSNHTVTGSYSISDCACLPGFAGNVSTVMSTIPISLIKSCNGSTCPTSALSIFNGGETADKAVDGNKGTIYNAASATNHLWNWWRIDFMVQRQITDGIIWGLKGYTDRLKDFQVWIGDDVQFPGSNRLVYVSKSPSPLQESFQCYDTGRYLYIARNEPYSFFTILE